MLWLKYPIIKVPLNYIVTVLNHDIVVMLTYFYLQAFSTVPKLQVTMKHGTPNQKHDAMSVWVANVSTRQFEVCLRESRTFDGPHSNIMVVSFEFRALNMYSIFPQIRIKSIQFVRGLPFLLICRTKSKVSKKQAVNEGIKNGQKIKYRNIPDLFIFCWVFDHQNWMAYERYPSAWKAKESSAIFFSENELPSAENNYALCKVSIYNLDA